MRIDKNIWPQSDDFLVKAGDLLSLLVLGAFVALLFAGSGLPLYSDEVVTQWMHARLFEPGGIEVSLFPQCRAAFSSLLPWAYYPGAAFFSALYGDLSPFGLRLAGVAAALGLVACFGLWAVRITRDVRGALGLLSLSIALLTLGVLPFLWVMARPEQWLILGLMFFCITAIVNRRKNEKVSWVWVLLCFPAASAFFFVHPKSLFFAPVVLLACWLVTTRRPIIRLLLLAAVLWLVYITYHRGATALACPEAPVAQAALSSNFLSPSILFHSPASFFLEGIHNLLSAPRKVAEHAVFAATFQSSWLPPVTIPSVAVWMASISRFLIMIVIWGSLVFGLLRLPVAWLRRKPITSRVLLGAALAVGLCANFFFYRLWPFYGTAQVLPLALMLLFLMLPEHAPLWLSRPGVQMARSVCLLFALASMTIFASYVVPEVWKRSNPLEASVPGQWLSVPALGFDERRDTIRALAHQCGIHGDGAEHLVVDHLTYYAFNDLRQPIHVLYLSEQTYGGDLLGEKLIRLLKNIKSPGLIAQCSYMPAAVSDLPTTRKGGYCCVPLSPDPK